MKGHTPGPWRATAGYVAADTPDGARVVCAMSRRETCMHFAADAGSIEDGANARLIAAAPSLLAVVKCIEGQLPVVPAPGSYWDGWEGPFKVALSINEVKALRAALAKAEGKAE